MSSVDNRVVKMQFDNASFKREALATKASLDQVDAAVSKTGSNKGLLSMGSHMDAIRVKASAMQVATVAAIATISAKATAAGLNLAKSLTIDPIKQGFDEYELKMKSIQTILSNTKGENLASVTERLDELNTYSDKTIYNFANMTENIGKLTTAGVNLGDATAVVKGFHNMVALAGGDATAAAGAMEQFSYGLQAGTIKAMDWMSISNRGLGSQSLQKAFFETARAAGTLKDVPLTTSFEEWTKSQGGFKASLEQGWLTSDVATKALTVMTGDMKSLQDVMALGFDKKTAQEMLDIADSAVESATKVRTFTAFLGTLRESIASGWSKVIESVVGDFNEATDLFTTWSNTTSKVIGRMFGYLGRLIKGWDDLGGRAAALKTFQHILAPIAAILGVIGKVWKAVFGGGETGRGLASLTKGAERATRPLEILAKVIRGSEEPLTALARVIRIVFNLFADGVGKVSDFVTSAIGLSEINVGDGGFVAFIKDIAKEIAKAIEKIDDLVSKGASLGSAFGAVDIKMPGMPKLPDLSSIKMPEMGAGGLPDFTTMFSGFSTGGAVSQLDNVQTSLAGVNTEAADSVTIGEKVMPALQGAWDSLRNFFEGFDIEELMQAFNLAVLSTFIISISRFMNTFSQSVGGFAKLGPTIISTIEGLGGTLDTFASAANKQAWAAVILNVAIAIGILAVALWLLSKIPADKMVTALAGMAGIMMIMKVGVDSITKAVEAMDGKGTPFKLIGLSIALLALGAAVLMLSGAFLILNKVDWSSMLKGLGTIIVVMKLMEAMGKVGEHGAKNLMASAVALMALSVSMVVLAGALMLFQLVDWESMLKGGLVLGAIVGALFILATIPYAGIEKVGLAMFAAAIGFLAIANALLIFGLVSWESIVKGGVALLGLTAALAILQVVGNPVTISGMIGLGVGLLAIAAAMLVLNSVEWSSLGKMGVVMLGLIAAFALFMGIVYLAAPVLPLLTGLALSLALLAGAIALMTLAFAAILPLLAIGVGAFAAFATGAAVAIGVFLTSLALQAPIMKKSVLTILQALIDTIVEAVPMVIDGFKRLWAAIKKEIGSGGGGGGQMQASMGKAGDSWMTKLGDAIKKRMPGIVDKAVELGKDFIDGIIRHAPTIAQKGAELVIALINGISSRLGGIVDAAVNLVIKFAEGISNNLSRILQAGVQLIADFLHQLANTIRSGSAAIGGGIRAVADAMRDVGVDMVKGLINGVTEMMGDALAAIGNLASGMVNKAKGILDIFSPSRVFKSIGKFLVEGLTIGIQQNAASAITAVASMVGGQIAVASAYVSDFVQRLDQQAIAATAKAEGLARAAATASKLAEQAANKADKTKGKGDDKKAKKAAKSADKLEARADRASKAAERAEARADEAAAAEERKREFAEADTFDKAKMRSEDAQTAMDAAKLSEKRAAASLAEAAALEKQAKADGVNKKQRKEMLKQAEELRKAAKRQAEQANSQLGNAQTAAADALAWQKQAGDEAAAAFQAQFDREAQEDAAADAFEKLSTEEKAAERRRQAAALQAEANKDLADAKILAYTDLEAANELAAEAMEQAEQARTYLDEAAQLEQQAADAAAQGSGQANAETNSTVVNLDPTEAASIAFNRYNDLYSDAAAAAAGTRTVEINQYNTSPESLNPSEIYRQTNNLLSFAADRL